MTGISAGVRSLSQERYGDVLELHSTAERLVIG